MARQLKNIGEEIPQVTIMAKILCTPLSKFTSFVTAWDNIDPERQTVENLTLRLVEEESRITSSDEITRPLVVSNKY